MKTLHAVIAALCSLLAAAAPASANLVANPGFEAGDFAGWTASGGDTRPDHSFVSGPSHYPGWNEWLPHGGNHFAALGAVEGLLDLSQTFATNPGESYLFSFQLGSDGETFNYFRASWNGSAVVELQNQPETPGHDLINGPPAAAYRAYHFAVVATSPTTSISLISANTKGWWALDDVSVTPLPEPAALAVEGAALLAVAGLHVARRRRRAGPDEDR